MQPRETRCGKIESNCARNGSSYMTSLLKMAWDSYLN